MISVDLGIDVCRLDAVAWSRTRKDPVADIFFDLLEIAYLTYVGIAQFRRRKRFD